MFHGPLLNAAYKTIYRSSKLSLSRIKGLKTTQCYILRRNLCQRLDGELTKILWQQALHCILNPSLSWILFNKHGIILSLAIQAVARS